MEEPTSNNNNVPEAFAGPLLIPYPSIGKHAVIGDRRTAALVSADGTVDWLCLPDYDGTIVFGAVLDSSKGGFWRLGPTVRVHGKQRYSEDTMVLETKWDLPTGSLLLSDAMLWPEKPRPPEQTNVRALVRCLRCIRGKARCRFDLQPAYNCAPVTNSFTQYSSGYSLTIAESTLRLWASSPLDIDSSRLRAEIELHEGEELWAVLEFGAAGHGWSIDAAKTALEKTQDYWRNWLKQFNSQAVVDTEIRRTALAVHLLTYAPEGSVVAAPTTSLPERIGGAWNADYRLCWVRDASLAVAALGRLGDSEETQHYLQWLTKRQSRFGQPLNVLYDIRGGKRPRQHKLSDATGYRGSQPIRIGNHAYKQRQFGSFGFLADCVWLYLQEGGPWQEDYWHLIRRSANFTAKNWSEPDNGIWELPDRHEYVHSKLLCWVMLDRAIKIAQKVNDSFDTGFWQSESEKIRQEILEKGWSEHLGAFRQRYDAENLDAAELLISVMEFLPGNDPRVLATIDRIAEFLTIDGFVYRFDPRQVFGPDTLPLGEFEGAFLPCTFWLATAYAKAGRLEDSRAILVRAEQLAGETGLFAESVDPRDGTFLGNTPLLFSHVEYVRAKLELAQAQAKRDVRHAA